MRSIRSLTHGAHNTMGGIQIPSKLASRWFGPYQVLEVKAGGAAVRLDLPPELGKMSDIVNIRRLKFDEPRRSDLDDGSAQAPTPLIGAGKEGFFKNATLHLGAPRHFGGGCARHGAGV